MSIYHANDLVLLAANPYHLGLVQADQVGTTGDVLVEWMDTPPVHMRPHEIVSEGTYRDLHPGPHRYDIFGPTDQEYLSALPEGEKKKG